MAEESSIAGYARFCSVFAVVGVVFLFIAGYLLQVQPLYIKGPEDKAAASTACYQGAGLYFAIWVASIAYTKINAPARNSGGEAINGDGRSSAAYGSISTREQ